MKTETHTMGTCKECRWWEAYHKDDPLNSIGQCHSRRFADSVEATISSPVEGEWPVVGNYSGFDTGPDFGCIYFKRKEGE